jgi:hypothetical protein
MIFATRFTEKDAAQIRLKIELKTGVMRVQIFHASLSTQDEGLVAAALLNLKKPWEGS